MSDTRCEAPLETTAPGWDDPRSRRIARAAAAARRHMYADSSLRFFSAYAEGHVTYLARFGGGGEQWVRADRIALRLNWSHGRGSIQTLVGRRHASRAPTRIRYHLDHLSLFLNNFSDRIAVGEGQEVRDVPHPLAPGALDYYAYRLVDSLAMKISDRWFTVYRLDVRPRCADAPGLLGTLHIDRDSHAIARIAGSFTHSSYIDPTVNRVSVELENGLVNGRYWLPALQRVEVQRQLEWMELPLGGTIRSTFRILDYDFEPASRVPLRGGDRVAALPATELERYAGWRLEEMVVPPETGGPDSIRFERIRRRALRIAAGQYLGGTSPLRVYLPAVSAGMRVRRAEGLLLGMGLKYEPDGERWITMWSGYAFGRGRPEWSMELGQRLGEARLRVSGFLERQDDIGPVEAAAGVVASLGAAFRGEDFVDPYWSHGGAVSLEGPFHGLLGHVRLGVEHQRPAELESNALGSVASRPVRPVSEGTDVRAELGVEWEVGNWGGAEWSVGFETQLAGIGDFGYTRWIANVRGRPRDPEGALRLEGDAVAAVGTGSVPPQRLFLLGGRGTVPGFAFRGWGGDRIAYLRMTATRDIRAPWLGARLLAAVGWSDLSSAGREAARELGVTETSGLETSVGGGLALLWDMVRLDVARGLGGGEWEWMVSVNPVWREPL